MTFASTTTGQKAAERWVLIYAGGPKRPAYSVEDLTHLLAVVDTAGKPTGWLCSGTIFLEFRAVSGRFYMPSGNAPPSSGEDWTAYLDSVFAPGGPIARLDAAAGAIDHVVGTVGRRVDVAVMIPYPDPRGITLSLAGRTYKMTVDSGRLDLVTAYLQETQRRFAAQRLANVTLAAFYWLNEAMPDADTALVPRVGAIVRRSGARFLWIPYYTASGASRWRSFGFDEAWLQPNFFFHPDVAALRLDSAVVRARATGMGLEVEFDQRMFGDWRFTDRLEPYLAALEGAADLRTKSIAIYEGAGALIELSRSRDSWHRALYDRFVATLQLQ